MTEKESKWIKFYPSLALPKERVSIAYATHDEREYRFAYGYFQFYNGTCGCFWKDGNEQPKVVKAEDIKYWMPVPSLDMQEEPVSDFEMALTEMIDKAQKCVVEPWAIAAQWKDELIKLAKSEEPVSEDLEKISYYFACMCHPLETAYSKTSPNPDVIKAFKAGAKWQKQKDEKAINENALLYDARLEGIEIGKAEMKQQMMVKAIDANCFGFQGDALFSFKLPADKYLVGSKVKVIVIKED